MTVDDNQLNYSSNWDIDQLVASDTVTVSSGTTALFTVPTTLPNVPVFEVQLKVNGKYYQSGKFATSNTLATQQSFLAYVQAGVLYINTTVAGVARYFVWQDRVNY